MASIAMLVGGALVNALAFSGSNYLFTMLKSSGADVELRRQGHALKTFQGVDKVMRIYAEVTRKNIVPLAPEPQLSDYYHPSDDQKDREIAFVLIEMAATGLVAYKLAR